MRKVISMNEDWTFTKPGEAPLQVNVPHTWNNIDGADGGNDYWRGTCTYEKQFQAPAFDPEKEEVWLQFDGVNATADVSVNGQRVVHHDGGYSTFRANISRFLQTGGKAENTLTVLVDNSVNDHVYPQKADFTFYGGIYRDVTLLVVPCDHIALNHLGSSGVKVTPHVAESDLDNATIRVETMVEGKGVVRVSLFDQEGALVGEAEGDDVTFTLKHPHLWNGVKDPYLYTVRVQLLQEGAAAQQRKENADWVNAVSVQAGGGSVQEKGKTTGAPVVLDEVRVRCGIRCFRIDAKTGFWLNGKRYPLHGVSRHQDRKGFGNALTPQMHEEDMALIREVGANTIRLAHYQHAQYFYDLCDAAGMVVWAEIPYISEHLPFGRNNTLSQMRELITQNYNHPSICVWGISNEITISTKDKKDMLDNHHALNDLCHEMDPTRLTTLACYAMCGPFNPVAHITDAVSWNLYLGWYVPGKFLNDLWVWFFHLVYPNRPLGFSEYGAEGMPNIHAAHPRRGDQSEEYQAQYHEYMLRFFRRNPWMWATHVWNMFDFAADARDQGGEPGMNHKGLVTYDRKTKKDSFYLYKAWWNDKDPFVHICSKRFVERTEDTITVKVYSNQPSVTLLVNGREVETKQEDKVFTFQVPLEGETQVKAIGHGAPGGSGDSLDLTDSLTNDAGSAAMDAPTDANRLGSAATAAAKAGATQETTDEATFRKVSEPNPAYQVVKSKKKSNWV